MELVYGFTFLIINELYVVWFSIMDKVLIVLHPRPKRLSFVS